MKNRNIFNCNKTAHLLFFVLILFSSCKNPFNSNNSDANKTVTVNGTIHSEFSSLSRNAISSVPASGITWTITAQQYTDSDFMTMSAGYSTATSIRADGNFTISVALGYWKLSAVCESNGKVLFTTFDEEISINGTDNTFVDVILIAKPAKTNSGKGYVSLLINDASTASTVQSVKASWEDASRTPSSQSQTIDFAENSATLTMNTSALSETGINSGEYDVVLDFYDVISTSITASTKPIYSCTETINIYDNLTTNTWIKDAETTTFEITDECLDYFSTFVYEVSSPEEFKAAVEAINLFTQNNTPASGDTFPDFYIYLTNNIDYTDSNNFIIAQGSSKFCYILKDMSSSKYAKTHIIGKNGLKTIDLHGEKAYVFRSTNNDSLYLKDIEIKGSDPIYSAVVIENSNTKHGNLYLEGKILVYENKKNIYLSYYGNPVIGFSGPLSKDSRIGVSVGYNNNITQNFTNQLSAIGKITTDDEFHQIFFSDINKNIVFENGEAHLTNSVNNNTITIESFDDIKFTATSNSSIYVDTEKNCFNNHYNYTADAFKPEIEIIPYSGVTNIYSDLDSFTVDFVDSSNNSVLLSKSKGDSKNNYSIKENTGKNGLTFSTRSEVADNSVLIPAGNYQMIAKAVYKGKTYTASWNYKIFDLDFVFDKYIVPLNASTENGEIGFKVYKKDGDYKEITSEIDFSGSYYKPVLGHTDSAYTLGTSETISTTSINLSGVSQPTWYNACFKTSYQSISYEKNFNLFVDDTIPYYYDPNFTSIGTCDRSFIGNSDSKKVIDTIYNSNDKTSTYTMYLLGDINAGTDSNQVTNTSANETDFGPSLIRINAVNTPNPLKLCIKSYDPENTGIKYKINALGTKYAADIASLDVSTGDRRVLFVGKNANVTLDNVQLLGGKISGTDEGAAIYINKGGKLTIKDSCIGISKTEAAADTNHINIAEKASFDFAVSNYASYGTGSLIYINSDESNPSQLFIENSEIAGNYGTITTCAKTLLRINNSSFSYNTSNSIMINISEALRDSSYIDGCEFDGNISVAGSLLYFSAPADTSYDFKISNTNFMNTYFYGDTASNHYLITTQKSVTLNLSDCVFKDNIFREGGNYYSYGGGITEDGGGMINLNNCIFKGLHFSTLGTSTLVPALNNEKCVITIDGYFYHEGSIYLRSPYSSTSTPSTLIVLKDDISLPTRAQLNALGLNDLAVPTKYCDITINTSDANSFKDSGTYRILSGSRRTLGKNYNKFNLTDYTLQADGTITK